MTHIIYSAHHCPFCARAVSTLHYAGISTEIRTCDFLNMPPEADAILAQSSIPLLVHPDNTYIDESWDIVKWALQQSDPDNWLGDKQQFLHDTEMLVETYDHSFMSAFKTYKDSKNSAKTRLECEEYLEELEDMLKKNTYLLTNHITVADISIVAFIRLFAQQEPQWFNHAPYPHCRQWLKRMTTTPHFKKATQEHPLWKKGDQPVML